jgi:hypothetical protein
MMGLRNIDLENSIEDDEIIFSWILGRKIVRN